MVRTQIQLTDEQARRLKRLAVERGVSVAALIRDAVDRLTHDDSRERRWQRARAVIGKYHGGGGNVAEEHDRYFEEASLDWRR